MLYTLLEDSLIVYLNDLGAFSLEAASLRTNTTVGKVKNTRFLSPLETLRCSSVPETYPDVYLSTTGAVRIPHVHGGANRTGSETVAASCHFTSPAGHQPLGYPPYASSPQAEGKHKSNATEFASSDDTG